MRIQTEAVQFKADQKLIDYIEERLWKLNKFFDRITEVRVFLRLENSGRVRDKIAAVEVHLPGGTLFAKESKKTFEASIEQVTRQLQRQIKKYKQRAKQK